MSTFIKASLIRAARTIAQTAASLIAVDGVVRLGDVDWKLIVSASILSGILSVLTSIATGLPEVEYAQHVYMSHEEPDDAEEDDNGEE